MTEINIVVNVGDGESPKVEVKKPIKKPLSKGGVLQFPAMPVNNNPVLDFLGIQET
jgi:hypothetical protein